MYWDNEEMTARLPSLNGLRAFEAAARHLSFTQAASELNVTQTAISHQIKRLEEELGIRAVHPPEPRADPDAGGARTTSPASAPRSTISGSPPTGCCARTTTMC